VRSHLPPAPPAQPPFRRVTPAFSAALAGLQPQQKGKGFIARCPAHEDRAPSLRIDEGDGKVVLYCHAGCDTRDVVAALGLQMADLFDPEPSSTGERTIDATYDYTDENGQLLFQVVRYFPKAFGQRRPLPGGQWAYNLDGVDRVPYRLPEILAAQDVLIVEGEKDVDRLVAEGFTATTSSSGAGKWRPEYGTYFADKNVTIIPDNDDAGRKHAEEVRASLAGVARKVRVLELPGLAPKGDVSDYLAVHPVDDLRALLRPSIAPTLDRYIDTYGSADVPDLYSDLVPVGGLVIFVGQPRSFKTMAALQMMFSVSSGRRWLGHDPSRVGSCLYVSEEGSRRKVADRLIAMRAAYQPDHDIHILHREGITLGAPSWSRVRETLDEMQDPQLVVLDTLAALMTGDENSVADIREALRPIQALITDYGVTVALVHHINKGGEGRMGNRMRGSSALWGACDGTLGFVRDEDANGVAEDTGELRVETKDNDPRRIRFGFNAETMTLKADVKPPCTVETILREVAFRQAETKAAVSIEELRDYFGVGKSWFYKLVADAEAVGLERTAKGYYKVKDGMFG
jgi:putative DNA primase/helicase